MLPCTYSVHIHAALYMLCTHPCCPVHALPRTSVMHLKGGRRPQFAAPTQLTRTKFSQPRLLSGVGQPHSLRDYLEPYVRVAWFGWTNAASHPARVRLPGMQMYSNLARTQHPQTLFTINKGCNKHFSSDTNMDNAILSLAFLLNTDDAMVIALQHLHFKEKNASEKEFFFSMMLAMSFVGKFSKL